MPYSYEYSHIREADRDANLLDERHLHEDDRRLAADGRQVATEEARHPLCRERVPEARPDARVPAAEHARFDRVSGLANCLCDEARDGATEDVQPRTPRVVGGAVAAELKFDCVFPSGIDLDCIAIIEN